VVSKERTALTNALPPSFVIYAPRPPAQGLLGKKVLLQVITVRTTPWKDEPK
jgi:hypothetical protein